MQRIKQSVEGLGASFRNSFSSSQSSLKRLLPSAQTSNVINKATAIPRKLLLQHLESTAISRDMCRHIPLVMFTCIAFFLSVLNHVDVQRMSLVEKSVEHVFLFSARNDAAISHFQDIHTVYEFWKWFEYVFLDVAFVQKDAAGRNLAKSEWGRLMQYNKILGSIRLEQRRARPVECQIHLLDAFYGSMCHPAGKEADRAPFGVQLCPPLDYVPSSGPAQGGECLGGEEYSKAIDFSQSASYSQGFTAEEGKDVYRFWLDPERDQEEIAKQVKYLEARHWIDRQTEHVRIVVTLYNGELSIFTQCSLKLKLERGGYVKNEFEIGSVILDPYTLHPASSYGWDAAWYVCLLAMMVDKGMRMRKRIAKREVGVWDVISGGTIVLSVFLSFWWHLGLLKETTAISEEIAKSFKEHEAEVQDRIQEVIYHLGTYRILCSVNLILIMIHFLEVIRAQPRLAIIVETFLAASNDIVHFLIVFVMIELGFASIGTLLFGHQIKEFATLWDSLMTCFELLVADLSVWSELKAFDETTKSMGFAWVCTYICVVSLIILNMLLAIVMDSYASRQELVEKHGSEDLIHQVYNEAQDAWERLQGRSTLKDLLQALKEAEKEGSYWDLKEELTAEDMVELMIKSKRRRGSRRGSWIQQVTPLEPEEGQEMKKEDKQHVKVAIERALRRFMDSNGKAKH